MNYTRFMWGPNCMLRWDLYPFYNDGALQPDPRINPLPPPFSMPTLPPSSCLHLVQSCQASISLWLLDEERRERKENRAWIAVVTPVSAIVVVVLLGSFLWHMRRRTKRDKYYFSLSSSKLHLWCLGEESKQSQGSSTSLWERYK